MPKVAVVQFYFYPDVSAVSQLLGDLLCSLTETGQFDITVYCATTAYSGVRNEPDRRFDRLRIIRVRTPRIGGRNLLSRALEYLRFYVVVFLRLLVRFDLDVVVSLSSPPLVALPVALAIMFKRTRLVYYVEDLFPEILFDLGYVQNPWVIRRLQDLNRFVMRRGHRIVTLGEYMTRKILRGYPEAAGKIEEIPNWAPGMPFRPPKESGGLTITYSGNMGVAHDFTLLAPLLESLRSLPAITYRFVGGGGRFSEVREIFRQVGEFRLHMTGYTSRARHKDTLAEADVFIISQSRHSVGDLLPSKLYSYLEAGRPMIVLGPRASEIGRVVTDNDIGVVVEHREDVETARRFVEFIMEDRSRAARLCRRARRVSERLFGLEKSAERFGRLLAGCAPSRRVAE